MTGAAGRPGQKTERSSEAEVQVMAKGRLPLNRKKVHRIMRLLGWTMHQRANGMRPRVEKNRSAADEPNQRLATDIALVHCGQEGWCAFVPAVDCCTREVLGWGEQ